MPALAFSLTGFFQSIVLQAASAASPQHAAQTLDPIKLVLEASLVVKMVMLLLLGMSVLSWFIIGAKFARLSQAKKESSRFLMSFAGDGQSKWNAERLESLYSQLVHLPGAPIAQIFKAGYVELAKISSNEGHRAEPDDIENVERALMRAKNLEMTQLESALPILATTGSVRPFIGLFGTVWGIMNSFLNIGSQHGATLDVVAPGIAEALIATAIGLVAAIPAVMFYNYFIRRIRVLESDADAFVIDFLNVVRRHFLR